MKNMLKMYFQYKLTENAKAIIIGIIIMIMVYSLFVPEFEKSMVITQLLPGYSVKIPIWFRMFADITIFVFLARTLCFVHELYGSDGKNMLFKILFISWLIILPLIYGIVGSILKFKIDLIYIYIIAHVIIYVYIFMIISNRVVNVYSFYLIIGAISISTAIFDGGLAGITIFLIVSLIFYFSYKFSLKFLEVK